MSDGISISLPLSLFGDMPLDDLIINIKNADLAQRENQELKNALAAQGGSIVQFQSRLESILNGDNDFDLMAKFQALRDLSREMNNFVKGTR